MKRVSLLLAVVLLLSVLPLGAGAAGTQLAFTQQPQDCTAMPGRDTAVFSVQAVGDPAPTYQWQLKKSDTWENLFLVTQPTYTISRVYPDMDGWQYRCLATSGEKTIASQVVTLHARLNDITLRQLAITPPVAGEVPMQELPETDQYRFPRGIFWDPELHEGTFAPDTVYTATVYLEAKPTYTLDGLSEDFFQVPGATEVSYSYDNRGVVTAVFPKTGGDPLHYPVSAVILEGEGTVTFSDTNPAKGDTVTFTVTPAPHYKLKRLFLAMDYKDLGNGRYSFVMPASPFQVHVNFVLSDPLVYPYEDPAPYYATTAASYLYAAGIMQGTSETTFSPYAPMTRAMVATVLYRMAGEPAVSGDVTFSDVPADTWYTQAVAWAQEKGVIQGTSPTTFSPDSQVTREQLATMLWRYDGSPAPSAGTVMDFPDLADLSDWAADAMTWAVDQKIVQGYNGTLIPREPAIRGQVAAMLWRYLGSPSGHEDAAPPHSEKRPASHLRDAGAFWLFAIRCFAAGSCPGPWEFPEQKVCRDWWTHPGPSAHRGLWESRARGSGPGAGGWPPPWPGWWSPPGGRHRRTR